MIYFFRNIRRQLASENRSLKYLRYAIGEILLVMIGILLALQVNNWNEQRKDREKGLIIINSLNDELKANKEYLIARKNDFSKNVAGCRKLLQLTGPNPPDLASQNFDSIVNAAFRSPVFNPESADFERIIGSEDFNLIRYDSLKTALRKYAVLMNILRELEYWRSGNAREFGESDLRGYNSATIINHGQMFDWVEFEGLEKSRFHYDSARSLSDPLFEKDITNILQIIHYIRNRTTDVLEQLDEVQDLIQKNYNLD